METGERWAKLNVDGDEDLITSQEQVDALRRGEIDPNGNSVVGSGIEAAIIKENSKALIIDPDSSSSSSTKAKESKFDYELMYRTYERIPSDHRPPLPDRQLLGEAQWKVEMQKLWDDRQKLIKEFMDTKVEDTPNVLVGLIDDLVTGIEGSTLLVEGK